MTTNEQAQRTRIVPFAPGEVTVILEKVPDGGPLPVDDELLLLIERLVAAAAGKIGLSKTPSARRGKRPPRRPIRYEVRDANGHITERIAHTINLASWDAIEPAGAWAKEPPPSFRDVAALCDLLSASLLPASPPGSDPLRLVAAAPHWLIHPLQPDL